MINNILWQGAETTCKAQWSLAEQTSPTSPNEDSYYNDEDVSRLKLGKVRDHRNLVLHFRLTKLWLRDGLHLAWEWPMSRPTH
jgi:hypothetical protein